MNMMGKLNPFGGSEAKKVEREMNRLAKGKVSVRMEIEGESVHFVTVFSIKRGMVVVAKPFGLTKGLERGTFVRFAAPDSENGQEIRMEVAVPHFNLISGGHAFLCHSPTNFAEKSKRIGMRYNTSRYSNLFLVIASKRASFRIIDISSEGCKIYLDRRQGSILPEIGEALHPARIAVGKNVEIELQQLVLRSRYRHTAGFQLEVSQDQRSSAFLGHFIKQLDATQKRRLLVTFDSPKS